MRRRQFQRLIKEKLKDFRLFVVSNREPYIHNWNENKIECIRPASGLTIALDPMMQACGGIWFAHGSGTADRDTVDSNQKVRVPPDNPQYELKRIWLSKKKRRDIIMVFQTKLFGPYVISPIQDLFLGLRIGNTIKR